MSAPYHATYYKLDANRNVVKCDLLQWGKWIEANTDARLVRKDKFMGVEVSTVFLGMDHGYDSTKPLLWETMVFGGRMDEDQVRCSGTFQDALAMHKKMVSMVEEAESPTPTIVIEANINFNEPK